MTHVDAIGLLIATIVVILFIDWRLGRLFRKHELVEQRGMDRVGLVAETAADLASQVGRDLREMRQDQGNVVEAVHALSEQLRSHGARIHAVEDRVMRAGLIPSGHKVEP